MRRHHPLLVSGLLLVLSFCSACAPLALEPPRSDSAETAEFDVFTADARRWASALGPDAVLAVFDIDNTLLAMEQGLGSDQWYEWQKEQYAEDPCDPRVVSDRLAVQGALYFASAMRPTRDNAAAAVRSLQDQGIPVIALTSRGVGFRLQTFRELRRNGFDFRRTPIGPESGWDMDFIPDNGVRPVRYEDGVFLTTGQHKGAMLADLLARTGHPQPAVILMLDDKQGNLDAMLETFDRPGVAVRAWRFSAEDPNVTGFDPDASHVQWTAIEPALRELQRVLGPDHYALPESLVPATCAE